ncbi:hypothetical protein H920_01020 [Fukomys damarensis]|uniref:Uncharacterized protein n=1 Tax=Fukomys damarensis TaxID=885580 RepID=A0A091E4M3_FUKDA|nr:hypothetical protein H920_01020 [Fukomys damarensis]
MGVSDKLMTPGESHKRQATQSDELNTPGPYTRTDSLATASRSLARCLFVASFDVGVSCTGPKATKSIVSPEAPDVKRQRVCGVRRLNAQTEGLGVDTGTDTQIDTPTAMTVTWDLQPDHHPDTPIRAPVSPLNREEIGAAMGGRVME